MAVFQFFRETAHEHGLAHSSRRVNQQGPGQTRNQSDGIRKLLALNDFPDLRQLGRAWQKVFLARYFQGGENVHARYDVSAFPFGSRFVFDHLSHFAEAGGSHGVPGRGPVRQDVREIFLYVPEISRKTRDIALAGEFGQPLIVKEGCSFELVRLFLRFACQSRSLRETPYRFGQGGKDGPVGDKPETELFPNFLRAVLVFEVCVSLREFLDGFFGVTHPEIDVLMAYRVLELNDLGSPRVGKGWMFAVVKSQVRHTDGFRRGVFLVGGRKILHGHARKVAGGKQELHGLSRDPGFVEFMTVAGCSCRIGFLSGFRHRGTLPLISFPKNMV